MQGGKKKGREDTCPPKKLRALGQVKRAPSYTSGKGTEKLEKEQRSRGQGVTSIKAHMTDDRREKMQDEEERKLLAAAGSALREERPCSWKGESGGRGKTKEDAVVSVQRVRMGNRGKGGGSRIETRERERKKENRSTQRIVLFKNKDTVRRQHFRGFDKRE